MHPAQRLAVAVADASGHADLALPCLLLFHNVFFSFCHFASDLLAEILNLVNDIVFHAALPPVFAFVSILPQIG